MRGPFSISLFFNYLIALVWLVNGLFCKVFDLVPRHKEIIGRILGEEYSRSLTLTIGFAEILMAIWIVSRIKPRLNVVTQIFIIIQMNMLELILVPDLLLWGRFNIIFALIFCYFIWLNQYRLKQKPLLHT